MGSDAVGHLHAECSPPQSGVISSSCRFARCMLCSQQDIQRQLVLMQSFQVLHKPNPLLMHCHILIEYVLPAIIGCQPVAKL